MTEPRELSLEECEIVSGGSGYIISGGKAEDSEDRSGSMVVSGG